MHDIDVDKSTRCVERWTEPRATRDFIAEPQMQRRTLHIANGRYPIREIHREVRRRPFVEEMYVCIHQAREQVHPSAINARHIMWQRHVTIRSHGDNPTLPDQHGLSDVYAGDIHRDDRNIHERDRLLNVVVSEQHVRDLRMHPLKGDACGQYEREDDAG